MFRSLSTSDDRRAVCRWINWPFSAGADDGFTSDLINFTAARHSKGVRVQMYYTTRELSNRAAELPVLQSLGSEILLDGPGGGEWWLQEHLRSNYTPGWTTLVRDNKTDAAIGDVGASRWANYYIEGMGNLACASTHIDGGSPDQHS
eukprot:SAG11_NODE_759_length_7305_cov_2.494865_6_plen_147_part_00